MKKYITAMINESKNIVLLPLLFILLISILALQGCATKTEPLSAYQETDSILRVGLTSDVPLLVSRDSSGQLTGIEMDLLTRFAKKNNYLLETSIYSRDELFFALRRGEIDIAIPSATDTVILQNFLLPTASHLATGQRVLVNDAVAMFIKDKEQLNSDKITVLTAVGSTAANFAKKLFPQSKLISLRDMKSCIKKALTDNGNIILLDSGEAYVLQSKKFFLNSEKNKTSIKQTPGKLKTVLPPLTNEQISWALRRGDIKRQNSLNSFIHNLKKNGKLQELIEQYNVNIINE